MPGGDKPGGGLEVKSAYKMKNSALHKSAKHSSPMQKNYGVSPLKKDKPEKGKLTKYTKIITDPKTKEKTLGKSRYYIGTTPSDSTSFHQQVYRHHPPPPPPPPKKKKTTT
jgi:hypothetical protein